ncbi:MAG TPA: GNAT family N-acetyltransferase [Candidatus Cloacimonetes bacterium]|nr:GNAT family N-acetyltransferase [Candidatus Cloacimonadota bacterium]
MKIIIPVTEEDFKRYYFLRWKILRKPWNQPIGSERNELDDSSYHVMVCEKDRVPIGVGRLHFNNPNEAQIRFMAVENDHQGKGIGTCIMNALEKYAQEKSAHHIILYARENAVPFYQKIGYEIEEKSYLLFGNIQHYKMNKELRPDKHV